MNIDFHYYGTYVAARFAGYSYNEATTIAHAAQYVDDSCEKRLFRDKITDFELIPTVHVLNDMIFTDFVWTEDAYNELLRVWPVFHFLPGNYDKDNAYKCPYIGKEADKSFLGIADVWSYDEQAKAQFKLVCLPNSILVEAMVNDIESSGSFPLKSSIVSYNISTKTGASVGKIYDICIEDYIDNDYNDVCISLVAWMEKG
jgi:hypothetical protein